MKRFLSIFLAGTVILGLLSSSAMAVNLSSWDDIGLPGTLISNQHRSLDSWFSSDFDTAQFAALCVMEYMVLIDYAAFSHWDYWDSPFIISHSSDNIFLFTTISDETIMFTYPNEHGRLGVNQLNNSTPSIELLKLGLKGNQISKESLAG